METRSMKTKTSPMKSATGTKAAGASDATTDTGNTIPANKCTMTSTSSPGTTQTDETAQTQVSVDGTKDADETIVEACNKSVRSVRSKASRKRLLAELEAKEKLAELTVKAIAAERALIEARLNRMMETEDSDEELDLAGNAAEEEARSERIAEWLETHDGANGGHTHTQSGPAATEQPRPAASREHLRRGGEGSAVMPTEAREHRVTQKPEKAPSTGEPAAPQSDVAALAAALQSAIRLSAGGAPKYLQELPGFDGRSDAWLSFKSAFVETEKMFTNIENVARIRKSLIGAAREAASCLLIGSTDPHAIMEALERRFGRAEALVMREIEKTRALPRIGDNPREICVFANKVANVVATIEALKKSAYLFNPELVRTILEKVSPIVRSKWYDYAARQDDTQPDLKKLAAFLNEEADKCGAYAPAETAIAEVPRERARKKTVERNYATTSSPVTTACPQCSGRHKLIECKQFTGADVEARWEIARRHRHCFRCVKSTHRRFNCKAKPCGVNGCRAPHHPLLHSERPREEPKKEDVVSVLELAHTTRAGARRAYLKIAPVVLSGPRNTVETYALLDEGSTVTIIDEDIVESLGLEGPTDSLWVQGVNGTRRRYEKSKTVDVRVRGKYSLDSHTLQGARTVERLDFTTQSLGEEDIEDCPHLKDLKDQLMYQSATPKILIGQDNWELIVSREVRAGRRDRPVASLTQLGWVLHGCRSSLTKPVLFCGYLTGQEDEMETMMRRYFALESLGVEPKKTRDDPEQRALRILEETTTRLPDGRFQTGLLWREDNTRMPDNYRDAKKRLTNIEKRLDREPALKTKYEESMLNLFAKGYAEPATTPPTPGKVWYLPHFAVINPDKPKIRLVHDAAARTEGKSLNDALLPGPDLLQSLPGVVMRFRQSPYAVTADIREMFMQIRIRPEDRDALRFLWRGSERGDTPPSEYRMTSVVFGATSSSCTALFVKNKNAADYAEEHPEAAKAIVKNHYMDDYIASYASDEEAFEVATAVDYVHRQAGFELRGWASNAPSVLRHYATNEAEATIPIGGSETERTLGLLWEVRPDNLGFRLNRKRAPLEVIDGLRAPTKREALSVIMSLYDPLGLIAPVTTPAKRIMQDTWRYNTSWDDDLPEELHERWGEWLRTLRATEQLRIPRCYDMGSVTKRALHTFVDTSEEAYAAAVYWRHERADGSVNVALAAAKSRVTPLKPVSIPRLELQAALLGARLAQTVALEHDWKAESRHYWSDSRTALAWIRAEPRAFKCFVAHRLAEIEETTKKNEWRWVSTAHNVADDATRATPADFGAKHRWFRGSEFLYQPEECWPREDKGAGVPITGEEREACYAATTTTELRSHAHLPDITRFSRWTRLIRATARVLQFVERCRGRTQLIAAAKRKRTTKNEDKDPAWGRLKQKSKIKRSPTTATPDRFIGIEAHLLIRAEKLWVRAAQQDSYARERRRIEKGAPPTGDDKLAALSVTVGADGILRLKGRVEKAVDIPEEAASPAVLDGRHPYLRLYLQHLHERMNHGGVELVVNEVRQRLWVTRIRPTVKEVLRSCPVCRLRKAKPASPSTGNLPAGRLAHHARPFTFTGLDYFGPVTVTVGRHTEKRYVALFTCLTSRAVHLEIAASLSADSAISALRRFIARRGPPKEVWSDNGTNFKAAERELTAAVEAMGKEASAQHIVWRFMPPSAPFMAGAWERMVRAVKEALRATLQEERPSEETLHTLLVECENVVNSRPLTHVSVDPAEPEALTPNHILIGPNCHAPPPGTFTPEDTNARIQWRRAHFWRRWVREYLPTLQHRREPRASGEAPKIGDLVVIADGNLPRNCWPRGRITRTFPGEDGEVRVVEVTTSRGHVLRRPTKKIIVLPVLDREGDGGRMCTMDI